MPTLLNKLRNVVLYVVLAKHDNEQNDLLHRVAEERLLEDLPKYQEVEHLHLKLFIQVLKETIETGPPSHEVTGF